MYVYWFANFIPMWELDDLKKLFRNKPLVKWAPKPESAVIVEWLVVFTTIRKFMFPVMIRPTFKNYIKLFF